MTKFVAIAVNMDDGRRLRVFPRSRKTSVFVRQDVAIKALDRLSTKLNQNGWRGLIYATPYDQAHSEPVYRMAL